MPRRPTHTYISILRQVYLPELEEQKLYWKQQFRSTLYEDPTTPFLHPYLLLCDQQLRLKKQQIKRCTQLISLLASALFMPRRPNYIEFLRCTYLDALIRKKQVFEREYTETLVLEENHYLSHQPALRQAYLQFCKNQIRICKHKIKQVEKRITYLSSA